MVSTATSDNLNLLPSDPIEAKHNPHEPIDVPLDVDGFEDEEHQGHSSPKVQHPKLESVLRALSKDDEHEGERPHNVVKQPNGVVIIEKLDTPATRCEKNLIYTPVRFVTSSVSRGPAGAFRNPSILIALENLNLDSAT